MNLPSSYRRYQFGWFILFSVGLAVFQEDSPEKTSWLSSRDPHSICYSIIVAISFSSTLEITSTIKNNGYILELTILSPSDH